MKNFDGMITLYNTYKESFINTNRLKEEFSDAVVFQGFEEYIEKPTIEPYPDGDLMAYFGGSCLNSTQIISLMYNKGCISPEDFAYFKCCPKESSPEDPHLAPTEKKKYEKRNCVSIKWAHPENDKFYFSVGVSLYARGYGWSARASDGERYYWKRGHYYETDKKAAFFALSSLLDWLGKPTDRIGKCMRLSIWTNREQYNPKQMELFE